MMEIEGVSRSTFEDGREAWLFDLPQGAGNAWLSAILLVGDDGLTFARYSTRGGMRKAREAFLDAGGDAAKLGWGAVRIPRESLLTIGRTPAYATVEVVSRGRFGRRTLPLPTPGCEVYAAIFDRLHRRFGAGLPVEASRVRIDQIPFQPTHGPLLVAGIAFLLGLVCGLSGPEPPLGMIPVIALFAFEVGRAIGPAATWGIVGLSGAVAAYCLYLLIANRPAKEMVRLAEVPSQEPR